MDKRLWWLPLIVCVLSTCASAGSEGLSFQMDTTICMKNSTPAPDAGMPACWKVGNYQEVPRKQTLTEFIREGDDIKNWKELVTIQNFARTKKDTSPSEFLDGLKAVREKNCPGATEWSVIDQSANSILYEWRAKPCMDWPEQHEIARILDGKSNRYVIHYVMKVRELPTETRTVWVKKLADAKIMSNPF